MGMVKSAMLSGNGAALFPQNVHSVDDVPADLSMAIEHATRIISWHSDLRHEDIPPMWMMPFDDDLTKWFDAIKAKREADNPDPNGDTESEMVGNELSSRFRG